jgi:hypothetical protein
MGMLFGNPLKDYLPILEEHGMVDKTIEQIERAVPYCDFNEQKMLLEAIVLAAPYDQSGIFDVIEDELGGDDILIKANEYLATLGSALLPGEAKRLSQEHFLGNELGYTSHLSRNLDEIHSVVKATGSCISGNPKFYFKQYVDDPFSFVVVTHPVENENPMPGYSIVQLHRDAAQEKNAMFVDIFYFEAHNCRMRAHMATALGRLSHFMEEPIVNYGIPNSCKEVHFFEHWKPDGRYAKVGAVPLCSRNAELVIEKGDYFRIKPVNML